MLYIVGGATYCIPLLIRIGSPRSKSGIEEYALLSRFLANYNSCRVQFDKGI
jgi:hypothetical protein